MSDTDAKNTAPELSVITVTYNSKDHIVRCLQNIMAAANGVRLEVILVDNASMDGTTDAVREQLSDAPWLTIIANDQNLGFGKASNLAARRANGRYLLFLNPDLFLLPGAIRTSLDAFTRLDRCGAVMARTFWDDEMQFQFSCLKTVGLSAAIVQHTSLRHILGKRTFEKYWRMDWKMWSSDDPLEVSGAPGSYLMLSREFFRQLGGFDERFFMYYEDEDLCRRIRKAEHKIYCLPDAKAIHYYAQSLKTSERTAVGRMQSKSLIALYEKHYPHLGGALAICTRANNFMVSSAKRMLGLSGNRRASSTIPMGSPDGIELAWRSVPNAEYYFLEITPDPCFLHKVGAKVAGSRYFLAHRAYRMLTPDVYFWRAVPMVAKEPVGKAQVGRFRIVSDAGGEGS